MWKLLIEIRENYFDGFEFKHINTSWFCNLMRIVKLNINTNCLFRENKYILLETLTTRKYLKRKNHNLNRNSQN